MKKKHYQIYLLMVIFTILLHPGHVFSAESTDGISLPFISEHELSSDGKTLYDASVHEMLADDQNPNSEQISIPAPESLTDSATVLSTFEFTYQLTGDKDPWGDICMVVPDDVKEAFNYAGTIWGNIVKSSVPIKIQICRSSSLSENTLGVSGGGLLHRDFTNAPRSGTYYASSLANSLAKTDLDTSKYDTYITYNDNTKWYSGKDAKPPSGYYDLVTFVLHNICHGLNFRGSMSYTSGVATWGYSGYPSIYDTFMRDGSGKSIIDTTIYPNSSTALGTVVTSNNLWFHGSHAMSENGGRVRMYAPSTWNSGVSYSALDYNTFASGKNKLMSPFLSSGTAIHDPGPVTIGLLKDLGWKSSETADVVSLWSITGAEAGKSGLLGALVENIGAAALPSDAKVWFYVNGPAWTNYWVGSKPVSGLAAGDSDWYYFNWSIPSTASGGTYTYWARVYQGSKALSDWSGSQSFTITGKSEMISPVNLSMFTSTTQTFYWTNSGASQYWLDIGTTLGGKDIFSQDIGTSTSRTVSGLPSTGITLYVRLWTLIGSTWFSNDYMYMSYSGGAGFVSQFNGSATNWLQDSGSWSIYGSAYYYTAGRAGYTNTSSYNQTYSSLDYSAKLWRSGDDSSSNRIIIRASGTIGSDGHFSNQYMFQYTRDGGFSVYKRVGGVSTAVKAWTDSSAIVQGAAWNTLRVKAVGSSFYFYINGTLVWAGTDSSLSSGRVGMGMYRDDSSTGNGFWADWAVLTIPTSDAVEGEGVPNESAEVVSGDKSSSSESRQPQKWDM